MDNKLQIVYLPVDSLVPYEKNARKHEDTDVDAIVKSIQEFGMCDPIGIWSDKNIIVEGHGRLAALKKLGYKEAPCIRLDHLTDEQRKAYGLAHNRTAELSSWDTEILIDELKGLTEMFDMDSLGFSDKDFECLDNKEAQDDNFDIDKEVEEIKEPMSKHGDIYLLGNHRLMCGDSTNPVDVSYLMNGAVADLLFTDPPYNVNVSNSDGLTIINDNLNDSSFKSLLDGAFSCASESMRPGAAFYIWYASCESVNFRTFAASHGLMVKQDIIWLKNGFTFGRQDYKWIHEPCLYGWKDGAAHYFVAEFNHPTVIENKEDISKMTKQQLINLVAQMLEQPTDVIRCNKPLKNDLHPTMKPLPLCGELIQHSSHIHDIVLDLFGGSGSTLITCEQLNRTCYMMEYDPVYVDVIISRWEQFTGKKAIKL